MLDKLQKNEFAPRARPKALRVKWVEDWAGKTQKYLLELDMNEADIFKVYKDVYGNNTNQQAELSIKVNPGNSKYRVLFKSKTKQAELVKKKGEFYLGN